MWVIFTQMKLWVAVASSGWKFKQVNSAGKRLNTDKKHRRTTVVGIRAPRVKTKANTDSIGIVVLLDHRRVNSPFNVLPGDVFGGRRITSTPLMAPGAKLGWNMLRTLCILPTSSSAFPDWGGAGAATAAGIGGTGGGGGGGFCNQKLRI